MSFTSVKVPITYCVANRC
ncbi:hypothetical protein V3C99_004254 [Haemonchus contortus]